MNNSEKRYRVIISGGGTGGHIYPAVAIANELKRQHPESEILFVGALGKMEMTKVPDYGYNIVGLPIRGLQRKLTWENVLFPFRLISSYMKALKIISDFRPNAVVGTGGYASGPTVMAAQRKGIPVLIQEQNSYPGIANKRFAKKAKRICVAYEGMETYFDKEKLVVTGNPVRQDIMTTSQKRAEALEYYGLAEDKITILVLGGSLGARTINESVVKSLPEMLKADLQIVWQTGKIYYEEMIKRVEDITTAAVVVTRFIEKMDLAY
ncbi:MAG: UDP-N-acetylglucosamine--N-acetylmuramyl-(pentapeptide) pyrophosphoryl-undecaprenol N-acetylglucosamine transferase, partial [Cyclobacteriaceae bacterium]|nr:UDP-N-acetylglucosamine--N-acetylmuramyl-(pentapeptide) pyrophosphoryl-undecaprenol N-acetylglucosamine transferase [Cyclobacteriaceae bacterium]